MSKSLKASGKEVNFMKALFCEENVVKFWMTDLTPAEIH
jgi:hypothetical protein